MNIAPSASDDEVKRGYRALAKQYHPDTNNGDNSAAARFAEITEAYDVLGDGIKRATYDKRCEQERAQRTAQTATAQSERFKAQVRAEVSKQLAVVRDRAYAAGHERGIAECKASADKAVAKLNADMRALGAANKQLKTELARSERARRDVEQELFDRDRSLAESAAKLTDLEHKCASISCAVDALVKLGVLDDERVRGALDEAMIIALRSGGSGSAEVAAQDEDRASCGEITHSKRIGRIVLENIQLLKTAAVDGNPDAQNELGKMYYYGIKVTRDYKAAVYWFNEAVKSKHYGAMYNLGVCFVNGDGTVKNESVGQGYIRQAVQLGSIEPKKSGKKYTVM